MSRYQSKTILYGVELTHEQATLIYKNEMYDGSDLSEVIEMKTNNEDFYKDVCSEYDENPSVKHYLGVVINNSKNNSVNEEQLSVDKKVFELESENVMRKYNIKSEPALFILTSVC